MIRAVYMGSEGFSVPPLNALWHQGPGLETPVCLVGIVTQPDRRSGRGRGLKTNAVKQFGLEHQIPLVQPETLRDSGGEAIIATMRPDLLVVASYGQILPRRVLDMPPRGCLNLHPSLLPRHRGPSPVVGALLAGDSVTGVCLMQMTSRMDAGPIVACQHMAIPHGITAGDLTGELARMGASLLLDELPA